MMDFTDLIGVPFKYNGRDEKCFDCYGLVKFIFRHEKGIELPDYSAPDSGDQETIASMMAAGKHLWNKVDKKPGTLIYIRLGMYHWHVGYYIKDDIFIHTSLKTGGVCIERLSTWQNRIEGFYEYAYTANH